MKANGRFSLPEQVAWGLAATCMGVAPLIWLLGPPEITTTVVAGGAAMIGIALAWAGAHDLHTKAGQVVAAGGGADHFDRTACQAEHHRPDGIAPTPIVDPVQGGDRYLVLDLGGNIVLRGINILLSHSRVSSNQI